MTGFAIVSTTLPTKEDARSMAAALVDARLAACVQILPVESVYSWEGKVERGEEHLLLCKIAAADFAVIADAIGVRHSYEVPEIIMTPIDAAAPSYLAWLAAETTRT